MPPVTRSSGSGTPPAAAPGADVDRVTDGDLLRKVMNTVGKAGRLGGGEILPTLLPIVRGQRGCLTVTGGQSA